MISLISLISLITTCTWPLHKLPHLHLIMIVDSHCPFLWHHRAVRHLSPKTRSSNYCQVLDRPLLLSSVWAARAATPHGLKEPAMTHVLFHKGPRATGAHCSRQEREQFLSDFRWGIIHSKHGYCCMLLGGPVDTWWGGNARVSTKYICKTEWSTSWYGPVSLCIQQSFTSSTDQYGPIIS